LIETDFMQIVQSLAEEPLVGLASGRIRRTDRLPEPDAGAVARGADELDAGGLERILQGLNSFGASRWTAVMRSGRAALCRGR
jgi:hypothetical protein